MLTHIAEWQQFNGSLIAFAVALGLAVTGRLLKLGVPAAAAGGAGVMAGWYSITGRLWMISPPVSVNELTGIGAVALLIGLLCAWHGRAHVAAAGMFPAALVAGWFFSGAPRHVE